MSCRILDHDDWSFEVADDGFVHASKRYLTNEDGYIYSPYQIHRPTDFIVKSDRLYHDIDPSETYSVVKGIHCYLNYDHSGGAVCMEVLIKPEDIVMVGSFGGNDSIVAMQVELKEKFTHAGKHYQLIKTPRGIKVLWV